MRSGSIGVSTTPRRRGRRARRAPAGAPRRRARAPCRGRAGRRRRRRSSPAAACRRRPRPGRPPAAPARCRRARTASPGSRPRPGVGSGAPDDVVTPPSQPAHGPRAEPREHDAALPGVAQHAVQAVDLPDGQQVAHRAAADVDDVLGEDDVAQRAAQVAHAEEREHLGLARPVAEGGVEAPDLVARVAAGGGQEEDPRHRAARELQDELVERRVARRGGEAAAAQREDGPHATSASGAPRSTVGSLRSTTRSPRSATRQPRLPGPRGHHAVQVGPDEVQRGAVVGRVARAHAVADEAPVLLAPARLAVVVHAVGVRQQPEALDRLRRAVEGGHRLGEPAQRSGAQPAQHDAAAPRLRQRERRSRARARRRAG